MPIREHSLFQGFLLDPISRTKVIINHKNKKNSIISNTLIFYMSEFEKDLAFNSGKWVLSVVGLFFDWTQSYDLAFYFTGCCLVVGGAVPFLTALLCGNPVNNEMNVLDELDVDLDPELKTPSECNRVNPVA